jgi:hypothetical protein
MDSGMDLDSLSKKFNQVVAKWFSGYESQEMVDKLRRYINNPSPDYYAKAISVYRLAVLGKAQDYSLGELKEKDKKCKRIFSDYSSIMLDNYWTNLYKKKKTLQIHDPNTEKFMNGILFEDLRRSGHFDDTLEARSVSYEYPNPMVNVKDLIEEYNSQ